MQMTIDLPATLSKQKVRRDEVWSGSVAQRGAASLRKAAALAGLTRIEFQHLLAQCEVPVNYGEVDLEADLATLRSPSQQVQEQTILEPVDRLMERMAAHGSVQ